jgi:alpha-galactosidase
MSRIAAWTVVIVVVLACFAIGRQAVWGAPVEPWAERLLRVPYPELPKAEPEKVTTVAVLRQDFEQLEVDRSVIQTPLTIGKKRFARGLGTHSISDIRISSPEPLARLVAAVGVDNNERTAGTRGSVRFAVEAGGRAVFQSGVMRGGEDPKVVDVELGGATEVRLRVGDAGDGPGWDHADWAEARVVTRSGKTLWLDELPRRADTRMARYPFSFLYGGRHSDELLPVWKRTETTTRHDAVLRDGDRNPSSCSASPSNTHPSGASPRFQAAAQTVTTWTDSQSGLRVRWQATRFADFPAVEWLLFFENTGSSDTPPLADVQALDVSLDEPLAGPACYRLHRTNGAPSNPTDFEPSLVDLASGAHQQLGGGGGRSSNKDFPFIKIESANDSTIIALGWSGQWAMDISCRPDRRLHVTAGLELTHFRLHPGERVRMPRVLLLRTPGDTLECNAQFRQLLYRHYVARRAGKPPLPTLFCNTCFTRGGGWLNECNADNQTSLIRAYAPLGLEALLTDAGWFEGGWPAGAGNWNPRKDAYPQGMGPVAAAAKAHGMAYGLWFEFERVVSGTGLHRTHPQWLLAAGDGPQGTYLLNLGLPEVRQHLFAIVKGFMHLPGFRFYRSDFNMDPLPYWRHTDPPDRQGIAEMKYVEGLYAFWDQLADAWPDALREECASGGRRIDLETIMRMHLHQESDYWFDNEVDLAVVWSLGRYLPNNTFTTPLVRLDDRSFHSTMATSLIPGWIADAKDFDTGRAKQLTGTYRRLRHLLVGAYYPLTEYSRDGKHWMVLQFHRPDLDEGLVLAVPPLQCPQRSIRVKLHGLEPAAEYEVHFEVSDRHGKSSGAELMRQTVVAVPPGDGGERVVYRRVSGGGGHALERR